MIEIADNTSITETVSKPTHNPKYRVWLFLLNNINEFIQLTATNYKELKVWEIKFEDGRQAVLYKCGSAWMQPNEDNLTTAFIEKISVTTLISYALTQIQYTVNPLFLQKNV